MDILHSHLPHHWLEFIQPDLAVTMYVSSQFLEPVSLLLDIHIDPLQQNVLCPLQLHLRNRLSQQSYLSEPHPRQLIRVVPIPLGCDSKEPIVLIMLQNVAGTVDTGLSIE